MKGTVRQFDKTTYNGSINGYDGKLYSFVMVDWESSGFPRAGMLVEFSAQGESAGNVKSLAPKQYKLIDLAYLFSSTGRTSREDYWYKYLIPMIGCLFVAVIADVAIQTDQTAARGQLFATMVHFFFIYPSFAVSIKRLHDRGMSGWWTAVGNIYVLSVVAYFYLNKPVTADDALQPTSPIFPYLLFATAGCVWLYVAVNLFFLRGQPFENRYGPDPYGSEPDRHSEEKRATPDQLPRPEPDQSVFRTPTQSNNFLIRHWRGQLPLWTSYWIIGFLGNITALLIVLGLNQAFSVDQGYEPSAILAGLILSWISIAVIAIWQLVGVWRSASHYSARNTAIGGSSLWGGLAKLAVAFGSLNLFTQFTHSAIPQISEMNKIVFEGDPDIPEYAFRIMRNGTELEITGGFKYGLTQDVERLLQATPNLKVIHLDSTGGRIAEAEKLFYFIRERNIQTIVANKCASACTIAFLGGIKRWARASAKLGFHQAYFPGMSPEELADANASGEEFLRLVGLKENFIARAYQAPPEDMWYPTPSELLDAGVITGTASDDDFAISGYGGNVERETIEEKLLTSTSALAALKQYFPEEFEPIAIETFQRYVNGDSFSELVAAIRVKILSIVKSKLPSADNQTLIAYAKLIAAQYADLGRKDPRLCYQYASGDGWNDKLLGQIAPELIKQETALYERIFRTAAPRPPIDPAEVELATSELAERIIARLGPNSLDAFVTDKVESTQLRAYCRASIAMFEEAGNLNPSRAAHWLRSVLSEK